MQSATSVLLSVQPNAPGVAVHHMRVLQPSISRRSCCWRGTWPHQIRFLRRQSSERSLAQIARRSGPTTVLNLTESEARTKTADRSTEDARRRLNDHLRPHRAVLTASNDVGTSVRTCPWAKTGSVGRGMAGNQTGVISRREPHNERPS